MEVSMISVEPIEKILKCVLASGKVEGEKPLSLIIIAHVECGKTSIIRRYCLKSNSVFYTTDATAFGILRDTDDLKQFAPVGKLTHIVIPDLLTCIGRKQDTVTTFIRFMNSLIEEGVVNISTYAKKLKSVDNMEVKTGLITAIPPDPFFDKRHQWGKIGFLSRALPASFDYAVSTRINILSYIQSQQHLQESIENLNIPDKSTEVKLPFDMARKIEPYTIILANQHSQYQKVYGFRYQRQLQTFAKAIALLQGKEEVDDQCIQELGRLANFINLNFSKI
jgi:hypothetical protein